MPNHKERLRNKLSTVSVVAVETFSSVAVSLTYTNYTTYYFFPKQFLFPLVYAFSLPLEAIFHRISELNI